MISHTVKIIIDADVHDKLPRLPSVARILYPLINEEFFKKKMFCK